MFSKRVWNTLSMILHRDLKAIVFMGTDNSTCLPWSENLTAFDIKFDSAFIKWFLSPKIKGLLLHITQNKFNDTFIRISFIFSDRIFNQWNAIHLYHMKNHISNVKHFHIKDIVNQIFEPATILMGNAKQHLKVIRFGISRTRLNKVNIFFDGSQRSSEFVANNWDEIRLFFFNFFVE